MTLSIPNMNHDFHLPIFSYVEKINEVFNGPSIDVGTKLIQNNTIMSCYIKPVDIHPSFNKQEVGQLRAKVS